MSQIQTNTFLMGVSTSWYHHIQKLKFEFQEKHFALCDQFPIYLTPSAPFDYYQLFFTILDQVVLVMNYPSS